MFGDEISFSTILILVYMFCLIEILLFAALLKDLKQ